MYITHVIHLIYICIQWQNFNYELKLNINEVEKSKCEIKSKLDIKYSFLSFKLSSMKWENIGYERRLFELFKKLELKMEGSFKNG